MAVGAAAVQAAQQALRSCRLCPRDCGVDRTVSNAGAFCRLDARAWVYKELLSLGEEPAITPTWLIDLGGCSLRCLFCSEWQHVVRPHDYGAEVLDPDWFFHVHARRVEQGARSISFVGGDPTPSLPAIFAALHAVPDALPVVWNCNAMVGDRALGLLRDVVAVWSLDAKFGNPRCAEQLAGVRGFDADRELRRTIAVALAAPTHAGLPSLIVRHLLMPAHLACCTEPVLRTLAQLLADVAPDHAQVNVMTTFVPTGPRAAQTRLPELGRWNAPEAIEQAVQLARGLLGARLLVDGR